LVKRGVLKIYNDKNPSNSNNEKPKFWHKYKKNNQDPPNEMQNAKLVFNFFWNNDQKQFDHDSKHCKSKHGLDKSTK
jgi:hypothetical protein